MVIDIRANNADGAIPYNSFSKFIDMASSYYGAVAQIHCARGRKPPTCIGTDGSADTNRHLHVWLLGVDQ